MKQGLGSSTAGLLVVALSSCSVHQDDWAREFGIALCRHEQQCGTVSMSIDCTRPRYWSEFPEELWAVREGAVRYSPGDARRCIDLLATTGCINDLKHRVLLSTECQATFKGQLAEGEPCRASRVVDVCAPGLRCTPGQQSPACGVCVPVARAGEEHGSLFRAGNDNFYRKACDVGLFPVSDGGGPTGVCRPRASLGASCSGRHLCLEGLDCSSGGREVGTCISPSPPIAGEGDIGEACRTAPGRRPWCAWPANCDHTCWSAPLILPPDAGAIGEGCACLDDTPRVGEACERGRYCELDASCINGICTLPPAPSGQVGDSCASGCVAGLVCREDDVCQPYFSSCRSR